MYICILCAVNSGVEEGADDGSRRDRDECQSPLQYNK